MSDDIPTELVARVNKNGVITNIQTKKSYTEARRQAYLRNKEKISNDEKDKKRWISYYQEHKDEIKERKKKQRIEKIVPIDETKIKRYYELIEETKELYKEVLRKRRLDKIVTNSINEITPTEE